MNSLDDLLLETKIAEARAEMDRERLRQRAEAIDQRARSGLRARLGRSLVRAGVWLDPEANERSARPARSRRAGQRA
jgi:hypothetical protein